MLYSFNNYKIKHINGNNNGKPPQVPNAKNNAKSQIDDARSLYSSQPRLIDQKLADIKHRERMKSVKKKKKVVQIEEFGSMFQSQSQQDITSSTSDSYRNKQCATTGVKSQVQIEVEESESSQNSNKSDRQVNQQQQSQLRHTNTSSSKQRLPVVVEENTEEDEQLESKKRPLSQKFNSSGKKSNYDQSLISAHVSDATRPSYNSSHNQSEKTSGKQTRFNDHEEQMIMNKITRMGKNY
ncbi:UNKNOWN [Stylonychia lemnae]|uniref:Uncharacterized protein n=1 Tax=Stylonychia lemnae TaxID=5949 RepID=A0A078AHQ3_STYLE|nr:UNKNOWN [Stylonychia lemnae]|eukprot:CDW81386.1 UNKNOWN [Stylonychia lemnae]